MLFVVDARAGITPADAHFAAWLRRQGRPVLVVVNKAEGRAGSNAALEAYSLGLGEPLAVSAEHGEELADLMRGNRRPAAQSAGGRGGGGSAAETGHRRAAERGQVDPAQLKIISVRLSGLNKPLNLQSVMIMPRPLSWLLLLNGQENLVKPNPFIKLSLAGILIIELLS